VRLLAVLVTGGAGYIGSHMVRELQKNKAEIVVLDSLEKGHKEAVNDVKLYIGNINDNETLEKIFNENNIDSVVHFAAYSLVGESTNKPIKYFRNNLGGTINLVNNMIENGIKYFVFSSTAAVYGEPKNIPIIETDELKPTNPYGESKLAVEKFLKWCTNAYDFNYISLRYFNAAGADESGTIGEDHNPETHLIPLVLDTILGKRESISIYGNDYKTEDGTCIRDYIHVTDLITAHILALESLKNGGKSNVYNLGNGKGFSVEEVIKSVIQVTEKKMKIKYEGRRSGDPAVLIASSDKIKKELGWNPKYNDLNKIIDSAWNWSKNNPHGFKK